MTITAVAFDWGGVITVPPFSGIESYAEELGLPPGTFTPYFRGHPKIHELELGLIRGKEFFKYVCTEVQTQHEVRVDIRRLVDAADIGASPDGINREMLDVVARVQRASRTILLTNNVKESKWRNGFPFELFDEVLDSSIVGVRKPDPLIYRELIRLAGCPANEIMFFDDFEENLPAAAELGIQAIHYTGLDACQDELTRRGLVREADVSEA